MVPVTPFVSAAARGAFRVSEFARYNSEVLEGSTPYATTGGPDQLRGTEHLMTDQLERESCCLPSVWSRHPR